MHVPRESTYRRYKRTNDRIGCNRIKKLLATEYRDFADTILVESPFAETTRNGRGIRQVSLALTPSKLIVAGDIFENNARFFYPRGLDPSIECFELISVYPLEYVKLSVFGRRRRKILKARIIDGKARYYELGSMQQRETFWKLWCEQVERIAANKMDGSSLSESTAASSTSTSTFYLFSSEIEIWKNIEGKGKKTICRIWAHYGGAGDYASVTWSQKDLYLGPSHGELTGELYSRYTPVPVRFAGGSLEDVRNELKDHSPYNVKRSCHSWPMCQDPENHKRSQYTGGLCDVLYVKDHDRKYYNPNTILPTYSSLCAHETYNSDLYAQKQNSWSKARIFHDSIINEHTKEQTNMKRGVVMRKVSRFGFGVPEKCSSGLVLGPCRGDKDYRKDLRSKLQFFEPYTLMESSVKLWEANGKNRCGSSRKSRHLRRYGLSTAAHFLHSLGPWSVQPGERDFFQGRRCFSLVNIRRQPIEPELRLPVSRRQLGSSISCTVLDPGKFRVTGTATRGRVILFWTPDYWYRPRPAATAYRELRRHLNHLRNYRQEKEQQTKRTLFCRRKKCVRCDNKESCVLVEKKSSGILGRIFSGNVTQKRKQKEPEQSNDNITVQLRRLLKMNFRITVWDLDSTTLATQLTLVDRELFVRITIEEIQILVRQKTSRNAPNLGAWIAFSHRVSCLTVSEILSIRNLEMRARIVARFINVANKCFAMGNFQSCRSILAGLQAPPIYRLKITWSHLRTHHANRYETMERLCKIFKSPCSSAYRRAWAKAERNPPYIPYVRDLLMRLLGLNSTRRSKKVTKHYNAKSKTSHHNELRSSKLYDTYNRDVTADFPIEQTSAKQKQGFGKRILAAALTKIRFKRETKTPHEGNKDIARTSRLQALERKYFDRWTNIVLKAKIQAKEKDRWKNIEPEKKRIFDVLSWLTDCQRFAREYNFPVHSFACEFLLKARYREDRENFFISQKLEPPKIT